MMVALRQRVPETILKWIFAAVLILAGVSYVIWEGNQAAQARRELAVELLEQARSSREEVLAIADAITAKLETGESLTDLRIQLLRGVLDSMNPVLDERAEQVSREVYRQVVAERSARIELSQQARKLEEAFNPESWRNSYNLWLKEQDALIALLVSAADEPRGLLP